MKNDILTINAGTDHKNASEDYVALWPSNPQFEVDKLRKQMKTKTKRRIGVLIVDSEVSPLGTGHAASL